MPPLRRLFRNATLRNVLLLTSGTALGQVVTLAVTPLLTRFYDPADFGVFGVFMGAVGIVAAVSGLTYENAIVQEEEDSGAFTAFALNLLMILAVCLVTLAVLLVWPDAVARLLGFAADPRWLWLLPPVALAASLQKAFSYWATRYKAFSVVARSQVVLSGGSAAGQLLLGVLPALPGGLILGRLLGQMMALGSFSAGLLRREVLARLAAVSRRDMAASLGRHRGLVLYNWPRHVVAIAAGSLPAFLLASLAGAAAAGHFWFTNRLLEMPSNLVAESVRKVYYQRAVELRHGGRSVRGFFLRSTAGLAAMGIGPVLLALAFAPEVFAVAFGDVWREAGEYARWQGLYWFCRFVTVPSVVMILIYGRQGLFLIAECASLMVQGVGLVVGVMLGGPVLAVALYSVVGSVFYVLLFAAVCRVVWREEGRAAVLAGVA